MLVIEAPNVHAALPIALDLLDIVGEKRDSRNGAVVKFTQPVTTVYHNPLERVIFHPERDANPFFHFFESLWMLAGRNDVKFVEYFSSNIKNYSDDGATFHAAYGDRWRHHFNFDQLPVIIRCLKENPDDRRVVLQMWDPADLGELGKDFACNLQAIFNITEKGELDMLVTNRSNDIVWGCYGANAVHFSYLQEFIAMAVGVPVGKYRQMSNNLHAYVDTLEKVKSLGGNKHQANPYLVNDLQLYPLINTDDKTWMEDLDTFMEHFDNEQTTLNYRDKFFTEVANPLLWAYIQFKDKNNPSRFLDAYKELDKCHDQAWTKAAYEWLKRREVAWNEKHSK